MLVDTFSLNDGEKVFCHSIVLPLAVVHVLLEHQKATDSRRLFPSPIKECSPLAPTSVRKSCKRFGASRMQKSIPATSMRTAWKNTSANWQRWLRKLKQQSHRKKGNQIKSKRSAKTRKSPSGTQIPEGDFFAVCWRLCGQKFFEEFQSPVKVAKNKIKHPKSEDFRCFLELLGGFEPPTSSLPRMRSTYWATAA